MSIIHRTSHNFLNRLPVTMKTGKLHFLSWLTTHYTLWIEWKSMQKWKNPTLNWKNFSFSNHNLKKFCGQEKRGEKNIARKPVLSNQSRV